MQGLLYRIVTTCDATKKDSIGTIFLKNVLTRINLVFYYVL